MIIKIRKTFIRINVLFICSLSSLSAHSQSPEIDSLLHLADRSFHKSASEGIAIASKAKSLAVKKNDKVGIAKSFNYLSNFYWSTNDYKSALLFSKQGLQAAEICGVDSLIGDSWASSAIIKHSQDKYELAISEYQHAIKFYKRAKNAKRLGVVYLNIGACEKKLARFEIANNFYFKAAEIFQTLHDENNLYDTYNSIGNCFSSLKDYANAIIYHQKTLKFRTKFNDRALISQSLNNIGYAYLKYNKPDSAIFYLSKCLKLRQQEKDSSILVNTLQNLGSALKKTGHINEAESLVLRSINIANLYEMNEAVARGKLDMAEIDLHKLRYIKAIDEADFAEKKAKELKLPELLHAAYSFKDSLYTKMGNYKKALFYNTKKNDIKDSLFTLAKSKLISDIQIKYETIEKENDIKALNAKNYLQIKILNQQKTSIILLIITSLLILLLFGFAYHNYRLKNKANQRIQILMRDLHHRVKNNLMILSSLFTMQIEMSDEFTKNTLRENESRILAMNLIHNKLYMDNATTSIEMREYLTKLLQHIKHAFGGNEIKLSIDIDQIMIEADKAVSIGLLLHELMVNSIKHGFDEKFEGAEIYLILKQNGNRLLLDFGDNGRGIVKQDHHQPSFGLKLIELLVKQLGAKLETNYEGKASYKLEIEI